MVGKNFNKLKKNQHLLQKLVMHLFDKIMIFHYFVGKNLCDKVSKNQKSEMTYCQNPNLTTTQPQPNLNLVGFDMIIAVHTTTTPPPVTLLPWKGASDQTLMLHKQQHQH